MSTSLLVGTRKGLFRIERSNGRWTIANSWFLGDPVTMVLPEAGGKRIHAALGTGHFGVKLRRSEDGGKTWDEAPAPAYPPKPEGFVDKDPMRGIDVPWSSFLIWGLEQGGLPGELWYSDIPGGLFRSTDGGENWTMIRSLWDDPRRQKWMGGGYDFAGIHSILVDPRDAAHLYVGLSSGGVFESLDGGQSWAPLNAGCAADFLPGAAHEYGHDPHRVVCAASNPDRLWQQNHCGVYRMDREDGVWVRVGKNLPADIGDIGFPLVVSPFDPDTAWVFPMDGTDVWPRTAPGGRPAVWRTTDGGASWERQDRGLPSEKAWWTVKRQSLSRDLHDPLGLYLGTTSGEVWGSINSGRTWKCLARHLPHIYSVEVAGVL